VRAAHLMVMTRAFCFCWCAADVACMHACMQGRCLLKRRRCLRQSCRRALQRTRLRSAAAPHASSSASPSWRVAGGWPSCHMCAACVLRLRLRLIRPHLFASHCIARAGGFAAAASGCCVR
jgi:hypothetical protein